MSKENIVRYKAEELPQVTKTDWQRLAAMTDDEIDTSEIPKLDENWFLEANTITPESEEAISLRLDREIVDWFKSQGKGYQLRMNAVLRAYVHNQKAKEASLRS